MMYKMIPNMPLLALVGLLAAVTQTQAQDPLSAEARAAAEEEPLALDSIEVTAEGWSYEQEITLRLLRQALYKDKSFKEEARDDWVCWIDEATGSHFNYLNCARNGDLWALERTGGGNVFDAPTSPVAGYGKILRSSRPVNRHKLERALETLEGAPGFDEEFVSMVLAGEQPPRDVPDQEELDQFAKAYKAVGRMQSRGVSENRQISAIEAQGLTLQRYNRIAELTEVFQTVENAVAERLE